MGGMVLETNMNEIVAQVELQNRMEKSEVSPWTPTLILVRPRVAPRVNGMFLCNSRPLSLHSDVDNIERPKSAQIQFLDLLSSIKQTQFLHSSC